MKMEKHLWRIAHDTKKSLVKEFKIKNIKDFRPMAKNAKYSCDSLGYCTNTGQIRIATRHPLTKRLLHWKEVVDTVCHELAHLEYLDHSGNWYKLYKKYHRYIKSIVK